MLRCKNGKVICIFITVGNIYDSTQAEKLLHYTIHEVEDKAFDSEQIVKYIEKNEGICVILLTKKPKRTKRI